MRRLPEAEIEAAPLRMHFHEETENKSFRRITRKHSLKNFIKAIFR
jgi:hypothetical protein